MHEHEQIIEFLSRINNIEHLKSIKRAVELRMTVVEDTDIMVLNKLINDNITVDESFEYSDLHASLILVLFHKWVATLQISDDTLLVGQMMLDDVLCLHPNLSGYKASDVRSAIQALYNDKKYKECVVLSMHIFSRNWRA